MSTALARKRIRSRAEVEAEALQPASLLIVDDWLPIASMIAQRYKVAVRGMAVRDVILASSVADAQEKLLGRDVKGAGRPLLCGALVDLFLGRASDDDAETALEFAAWLEDDRYPLLAPIVFTGAEPEHVAMVAAARGHRFVDAAVATPRQLVAFASEPALAALLGTVVRPRGRALPVFRKDMLLTDTATLRYFEHAVFGPWGSFCLEARAFAIEAAGDSCGELSEYLLRSLDALFETVLRRRLWHARGLTEGAGKQDLHQLKAILGDLEELYRRWQREWRTMRADPLLGDRWEPVAKGVLPVPPQRPSVRRA